MDQSRALSYCIRRSCGWSLKVMAQHRQHHHHIKDYLIIKKQKLLLLMTIHFHRVVICTAAYPQNSSTVQFVPVQESNVQPSLMGLRWWLMQALGTSYDLWMLQCQSMPQLLWPFPHYLQPEKAKEWKTEDYLEVEVKKIENVVLFCVGAAGWFWQRGAFDNNNGQTRGCYQNPQPWHINNNHPHSIRSLFN